MDDPWANAWGDSSNKVVNHPVTSSWSTSATASGINHEETDIAIPSWSTGAAVRWDEPSDISATLWQREPVVSQAWETPPSPYETIPIGKTPSLVNQSPPVPSVVEVSTSRWPSPVDSSPPSESVEVIHGHRLTVARSPEPPTSVAASPDVTPSSPDAFGTFEIGLDDEGFEEDPWPPSQALTHSSTEDDTWGAGWQSHNLARDVKEGHLDEWDTARKLKQKRDRFVPPEVLSSIIHQLEEITGELWPMDAAECLSPEPERELQHNSSQDLSETLGLSAPMNRLVPDGLILPTTIPFTKTFVSKQSTEALRLTRHMPLTQLSPMAIFLASKGSTSWEASVKSGSEVIQDDWAPPGWRVLSKGEEMPLEDIKKKTSGGLLSFFGRRGVSNTSETTKFERSTSPVQRPQSPFSNATVGAESPRASIDSKSSVTAPNKISLSSGASSPHTATFTASPAIKSSEHPSFTGGLSEVLPTAELELPSTPASVVSRFLGRFSRPKILSSRNSMALSSDDLEFLSDIVPSHNDDLDSVDQLDSLAAMLATTPAHKLPPLIPPPPKLAPSTTLPPPPPSISTTPEPSLSKQAADVDFMSLFDSPSVRHSSSPLPGPHPLLGSTSPEPPLTSPVPTIERLQSNNSTLVFGDKLSAVTATSFNIPKPSISRSQTPVMQPRRNVVAIMSNSSFSVTPIPALSLPGPPSFIKQSIPLISPIPPPSAPHVQTLSTALPSLKAEFHDDDDDFADFLSSPADAMRAKTSYSDFSLPLTGSSTFSTPPTGNKTNRQDTSDSDFSSFETSKLYLASPPLPPEKPIPLFQKISSQAGTQLNRASSAAVNKPLPPRKTSRAADHQRTLSLMEVAAARGKWPAPPSPLPEVIPPPDSSSNGPFDLFDRQLPMQSQQEKATVSLAPSVSSPAAFPVQHSRESPHQASLTSSTFIEPVPKFNTPTFSVFTPPVQPSMTKLPPAPSTKNGVLSAQDLSFFEGL